MHIPSPRRAGPWTGTVFGAVAFAAAAALAIGPATATPSHRAGDSPSARMSPAAQQFLRQVLGDRRFMGDELDAISSGPDGAPIAVGQSDCATECGGWFAQPLSERWTGKKWQTLRSVFPGGAKASLSAISALSSDDAWAGGSYLTNSTRTGGLVEHWDGKRWTLVPSAIGQDMDLTSLSALSDSDVWAAGASTQGGIIQHWDGTEWTMSDGPDSSMRVVALGAIDSSDVWASGISLATYQPIVEHWDGKSWQSIEVPSPNGAPLASLVSLDAVSADDIWAGGAYLGSDGATHGLIEHWDGSAWSIVKSVDRSGCYLNAISGVGESDIWGVGYCYNDDGVEVTFTEHWNGKKWSRVPSPNVDGQSADQFTGVTAISSDNVWASGNTPDGAGPATSSVLLAHWNGERWKLTKGHDPRPQQTASSYVAPTAAQTRTSLTGTSTSAATPGASICFSNLDGDDSSLGVNSQNYETEYAAYDDEAAADVTLDKTCKVRSVTVLGTAACNVVQSEVVTFYADKNGRPGKQINSQTVSAPFIDGRCGSFDIPLQTVVLTSGTYWVSVKITLAVMTGGLWAWDETADQTGAPDAWRSKGGAYGLCGHWTTAQSCTMADNADLTLQLSSSKTS